MDRLNWLCFSCGYTRRYGAYDPLLLSPAEGLGGFGGGTKCRPYMGLHSCQLPGLRKSFNGSDEIKCVKNLG